MAPSHDPVRTNTDQRDEAWLIKRDGGMGEHDNSTVALNEPMASNRKITWPADVPGSWVAMVILPAPVVYKSDLYFMSL